MKKVSKTRDYIKDAYIRAKKLEDMKPKFQGVIEGFSPKAIEHFDAVQKAYTKIKSEADSNQNTLNERGKRRKEPLIFKNVNDSYLCSIFEEGEQLMNGDRDKSYGDFHQNFANIAKAWSLVLGIEVTPHQFGLCMAIMKIIREAYSHKRDNLVDGAVYLRMANEIMERAENEKVS